MDAQPKSRASSDPEANAKLLCEILSRSEHLLRQQARKHAELAEDAEDALQSAYVLFIERYRGDWEPLAWLYTTVKREAWALRRKVSRRRVVSLDAPNGSADSQQPWVEAMASDAADPEERAIRSEEIEERRRCLAALKPNERRAVGLFALGYSYAEICELTGWTHTNTGNPYDASKLRKRFKSAVAVARIRPIRFHDLRHTFGTQLAAAGAPLRHIQEWMGHRDYKTTLIYADYAPDPSQGARWAEAAFGAAAMESGSGRPS